MFGNEKKKFEPAVDAIVCKIKTIDLILGNSELL